MRLKLVGETIFQPGRILGTVADKPVVLGGTSALSAIAMGFVLLLHSDKRGEVRCKQVTGAVLASATYVVLLGAGITGMYFDVNLIQYCPQCSYMSCVPSPWWSCDVTTSTKMYCNNTLS